MDEPKKDNSTSARKDHPMDSCDTGTTQPLASPITDPTNPYNQESTGDWIANERTAERSNDEPGLTEDYRSRRGG